MLSKELNALSKSSFIFKTAQRTKLSIFNTKIIVPIILISDPNYLLHIFLPKRVEYSYEQTHGLFNRSSPSHSGHVSSN